MTPTPFQQDQYHNNNHHLLVKRETTNIISNTNNDSNIKTNFHGYKGRCPSSLKVHKDSHAIKKSSSPTTSSSSGGSVSSQGPGVVGPRPNQQRPPVIIYTHAPKVIHTQPKDFMALVQKLTGMTSSDAPDTSPTSNKGLNQEGRRKVVKIENHAGNMSHSNNNDDESSSVITEENCSTTTGDAVMGHLYDPMLVQPSGTLYPNFPYYNICSSATDLFGYAGDPSSLYDNYQMDFNIPI